MTKQELKQELLFIKENCNGMVVSEASKLINARRRYLREFREVSKVLQNLKEMVV